MAQAVGAPDVVDPTSQYPNTGIEIRTDRITL
jgi:hypothetical protein